MVGWLLDEMNINGYCNKEQVNRTHDTTDYVWGQSEREDGGELVAPVPT